MYQCFPWGRGERRGFKVFPSWHAHTIARQIKMFAADGVRGVFLDGTARYIDGYITIKLMDDPTLDVDRLLDEFFTRYYGAAAEPMKRLYLAIERTYMTEANYPERFRNGSIMGAQEESTAWGYLGTPERMEKFGQWLEEAKAKADTESARRRVAAYERDVWKEHMLVGRAKWESRKKQ